MSEKTISVNERVADLANLWDAVAKGLTRAQMDHLRTADIDELCSLVSDASLGKAATIQIRYRNALKEAELEKARASAARASRDSCVLTRAETATPGLSFLSYSGATTGAASVRQVLARTLAGILALREIGVIFHSGEPQTAVKETVMDKDGKPRLRKNGGPIVNEWIVVSGIAIGQNASHVESARSLYDKVIELVK